MGNRGLLHDEHQTIRRPFKLKAWITCVLQFKGRQRKVMSPDRYTELFFLDEATSFAAGHRPCFECRREDAVRFKKFWLKGNPEYGFDEKISIGEIDKIIHGERIDKRGGKVTYEEKIDRLPDGSFVETGGKAYLVAHGKIFSWSPFGYEDGGTLPAGDQVKVLTPGSIVNTIRAGYVVDIRPMKLKE